VKRKWLIAGPLILIELALCGAIVGLSWASVAQARVGGFRWRLFSADTVSAEADDSQTFTVAGPATLTVKNTAGNVTVIGGTGHEIVVDMHKMAWGADQADANNQLARLTVNMTQTGNAVSVQVEPPIEVDLIHIGPGSAFVIFTITVPADTAVTVGNDFGNVTLSDTQGDVDLQTNSGKVRATEVNGDATLNSDFGDVILSNASAGNVDAHSNAGNITLTDVQAGGDVLLESDFGVIEFERGTAESLTVTTNSGKVTLASVTVGSVVDVQNDFGNITLTDVDAASYDVHTNSGDITITGASGAVTAHSDFGDVTVTNAEEVTLDLKTNAGTVTFSGSLGIGPHTLTSDFGNVRLTLPADSALTIDLKTDFGKITSALPITASGELDDHWQGTINGGGASLTVKTNSGNISLDLLNP